MRFIVLTFSGKEMDDLPTACILEAASKSEARNTLQLAISAGEISKHSVIGGMVPAGFLQEIGTAIVAKSQAIFDTVADIN